MRSGGHEHPGAQPIEGRQEQAGEGLQDRQHIPVPTKCSSSKDLSSPGHLGRQLRLCIQDLFHVAVAWSGFVSFPPPPGARAVPPAPQPELGFTALPRDARHGSRGREPEKAFAFSRLIGTLQSSRLLIFLKQ